MGLGINCVILANHLVSLITSSTTDPRFVAWGARLVLLVEQELPTNLEHTSSLSVFRGVRAAQSLVFCVVFCLSLFVFRGVRAAQSLVFCVVFCLSLFVFRGVRAAQSLVFCVVFCLSLFVCLSLFPFVVTLSVLLFTASDWSPIGYLQTYFDGIERTKSKILKTCIMPLPRY